MGTTGAGDTAGAAGGQVARVPGLAARVAALERAVAGLAGEVRTRRIVVEDGGGQERIVGEVCRSTAELRLELPGESPGSRSAVVLFCTPPTEGADGAPAGLGPGLGIQLWARGDAVTELDTWPDEDGRWRPHLHVDGGT